MHLLRFIHFYNTWHLKRSNVHNQNIAFSISPTRYSDKIQLFNAIARIVYFSSLLAMCSSHFPSLGAAPQVTSSSTRLFLPAKFFAFLNFVLLTNTCLLYNTGFFVFDTHRCISLSGVDCSCLLLLCRRGDFKWPALTAPFSLCRRFIRQGAKLLAPAQSERTAEHITAICCEHTHRWVSFTK